MKFFIPLILLVVILSLSMSPFGLEAPWTLLETENWPLLTLRVSRIALGFLAGFALCAAGLSMQVLFQNPLADPYILGVSGGAALFGSMSLLFSNGAQLSLFASAFSGALFVAFLLLIVAKYIPGRPSLVLLFGVGINAFCGAFITLLKTLAAPEEAQSLLFWLMGFVAYPSFFELVLSALVIFPAFAYLLSRSQQMEILLNGDEEATRLGVDAPKEKGRILFAASLLVGVVVAQCGMIAFLGLVLPNLFRLLFGVQIKKLLLHSALFGGTVLVLLDTVSKGLFTTLQTEIPVGALCALLFAPLFVWILLKQR